ncbi:MAG: glycosyltransferase [bacterium]|nr:glycosyltransferase [bacterium]
MAKKIVAQIFDEDSYIKKNREYKKECLAKIKDFNANGKKTIAIFTDAYYPIVDGVVRVLDNYAKRLTKDYNVVVCAPLHKGHVSKQKYLVLGAGSLYFKAVNYDLAFPTLDGDFNDLIRKLKIDIIHVHSPFSLGSFAIQLAKKRKIPVVATFHSQYKKDFYQATKSELLTSMLLSNIMKVFNKATEVWTMHQASLETLISYGFKGNHYLIENATDFVRPDNINELEKKIRKEFNVSNDEKVFLFVGRLVKTKNIIFLVEALKALKDRGVKFRMFFVGSGPDKKELSEKISELGLTNEVTLVGSVTDRNRLYSFYQMADLFLFPSLYDVSSIVQIEAACFKTPAVFLKGSVTSCTVTDNVNGFVAENSLEGFVDKVYDIVKEEGLIERIGEQAHRDLYITWEQVIEKAKARYEMLMKKNERLYSVKKVLKESKKASKK